MTNTEIIQAIKAEIERRLANYHPEFVNHGLASGFREDGKAIAYEELLSYISTLESEKPMQEVLEKEAVSYCFDNGLNISPRVATDFARHFYDLGCRRTAEKYDEIEYNRQRFVVETPNDPGDKVRIIILPKEAEQ